MKAFVITAGSFALTTGVILNAYLQKRQFYPSVVYITKSSPSMAVLYLQAFVFVLLMARLMRKVFFGQLRPAEMEHLIERSWYAVTETCLAFTVFRDDFSPRFVALFTLLLFLKGFHWLAEDRIDYMERSPLISLLFHLRAIGLIVLLGLLDACFVNHAYYSTLMKGASVQLVFGFEYAILFTVAVHILVKYFLHTIDLQSENPWENKAVYLLYTELVLGFVKVVLYISFLFIMIKVHTFPLFAIRPMYLTLRSFKKALNDVIMSRRAINNMNTLYPDATEEELSQGDNVCIICREDMLQGCKKLPCNHIFHTSCLRSWFQRQQTCPTCRLDVLRPQARRPSTPAAQPQPQQQQPQPQQPQPPQMPGLMPGFPGFPGWPPQQPQAAAAQQPQQQAAGTQPSSPSSAASSSATTRSSPSIAPGTLPTMPQLGMPPFMLPPFFMPMPFTIPPPVSSPDFSGLSDEELRQMEGTERQNVEARVQCLKNIQTLLDAAVLQMQQYSNIVQSKNLLEKQSLGDTVVTTSTKTTPTPVATGGARPKTSQPTPAKAQPTNDTSSVAVSELEGAVGGQIEDIPEWTDPREEVVESSELSEVRRRRLERFSSQNKDSDNGLDLD